MKSSHHDTPLYVPVPQPADRPDRSERVVPMEQNIGEDHRAAAREWLAHLDAGRINPEHQG